MVNLTQCRGKCMLNSQQISPVKIGVILAVLGQSQLQQAQKRRREDQQQHARKPSPYLPGRNTMGTLITTIAMPTRDIIRVKRLIVSASCMP